MREALKRFRLYSHCAKRPFPCRELGKDISALARLTDRYGQARFDQSCCDWGAEVARCLCK